MRVVVIDESTGLHCPEANKGVGAAGGAASSEVGDLTKITTAKLTPSTPRTVDIQVPKKRGRKALGRKSPAQPRLVQA